MRRIVLVVASVSAVLVGAGAAGAQPPASSPRPVVELRFDAEDGARWTVPVPSLDEVTRYCGQTPPGRLPADDPLLMTVTVNGRPEAQFLLAGSGLVRYMVAMRGSVVPPRTWCRATAAVVDAAARPSTSPPSRWPWLAFIAVVGGFAVAIGLVTMWGGGVGPLPELELSGDDTPGGGLHTPGGGSDTPGDTLPAAAGEGTGGGEEPAGAHH